MIIKSKSVLEDLIKACYHHNLRSHADDYINIFSNQDYLEIEWELGNRLDLIKLAIKKTNAKSYLEIGCENDEVFANIVDIPVKVGVDPYYGGNVRLSSDDFFSLNTQKFDVIFVDGLHYYEQVKRDVFNSLKFLNENGIVIIHDMLPITKKQTLVHPISDNPPRFYGWVGDVWRLSFDLMVEKNINFKIVNIDLGCGIILPGNQDQPKYQNITWEDYVKNHKHLPIISYTEIEKILKNYD